MFESFPQYFDLEGVPVKQTQALDEGWPQVYRGDGKWEDYHLLDRLMQSASKITSAEFQALIEEFDRELARELERVKCTIDGRPDVSPICNKCIHLRDASEMTCDAYPSPDRIPRDIWCGYYDHKEPFLGDNGIIFELRPDLMEHES